jgi:N4-(beta-N-acetylglucosaminyl)-L-asparaginase
VTLDASIMASPARCGAVSYMRRFPHPVSVARLVMEKLRTVVLLSGEGADRFATRQGLAPANLLTDRGQTMWRNWIARHPSAQCHDETAFPPPANMEESDDLPEGEEQPHNQFHDTVGVLALDARGEMAGACSTSGLPFKVPGRVGDSPIVGHGLYVDPKRGAAVATGVGELIMGICGSFLAVELMGRGATPKEAAREVLQRILDSYQLRGKRQVAIIAMHPSGKWSSASLRPGYYTALRTATRDELVPPECVLLP